MWVSYLFQVAIEWSSDAETHKFWTLTFLDRIVGVQDFSTCLYDGVISA